MHSSKADPASWLLMQISKIKLKLISISQDQEHFFKLKWHGSYNLWLCVENSGLPTFL